MTEEIFEIGFIRFPGNTLRRLIDNMRKARIRDGRAICRRKFWDSDKNKGWNTNWTWKGKSEFLKYPYRLRPFGVPRSRGFQEQATEDAINTEIDRENESPQEFRKKLRAGNGKLKPTSGLCPGYQQVKNVYYYTILYCQ